MKKILSAALMCVALAGCQTGTTTVGNERWETFGWNFTRSLPAGAKEYGYRVVSRDEQHPVRYGRRSARFEVQPGDCSASETGTWSDCKKGRERSELTGFRRFGEGDEHWYTWSMFLPPSHKSIYPAYNTFAQFKHTRHGHEKCNSGILYSFTHGKDGHLYLAYRKDIEDVKYGSSYKSAYGGTKISDFGTQVIIKAGELVGQWHDFVVHVRWSKGADGFLRVRVNDQLRAEVTGPTMRSQCLYAYFKYGIYRTWLHKSELDEVTPTVVYFDGVQLWDSASDIPVEREE